MSDDKTTYDQKKVLLKLKNSFPYFANHALKIDTKDGDVKPLVLNRAQLYLHSRLEEILRTKGKIRVIVIKGRQMGISTYIEGRFYHNLWRTSKSLQAFIMTHSSDSTDKLFKMAKRFCDNHPTELLKPGLDTSNAKELILSHNKGNYSLATAGSKEVGRGSTIHLFHGSEVAFWENAETHILSAFQAVPKSDGSEIILESTAKGINNLFHNYTMAALAGQSEYEAIFLPWFIHEEYATPVPEDFPEFSVQWMAYSKPWKLTWEQLYWAYMKNQEMAITSGASLDEPCSAFKQEYPAYLEEAFQHSGSSFISADAVIRARKATEVVGTGLNIVGIDPSRSLMGDKIGIINRRGRVAGDRISMRLDPTGDVITLGMKIARHLKTLNPDFINIDIGGVGAGVHDYLWHNGFRDKLNAVGFGEKAIGRGPTGKAMYANRRAEMYDEMREWFMASSGEVSIPDDQDLATEICAAENGQGFTDYNTSGQLVIESKDSIKKKLKGKSPDLCDALALTFAVPLQYLMPISSGYTNKQPKTTAPNSTGY